MGILTSLLFLCLFTLPFGELFRYQFGNGIAITANDVAIGITGIYYFFINKNKKEYFILIPFIISIILSLIVNLTHLSLFQLLISVLYPIRWLIYIQLFYLTKNLTEPNRKKILNYSLIFGGLFVFFGFIQYIFYNSLKNLSYLGWDRHMYRLFSTFLDPNFAGIFAVLYFLLNLGLFFNKKDKTKYTFLIISFLTLVAVFVTYSRSAMIMLLISTCLLLFLLKKTKLVLILFLIVFSFYLFISRFFYVESINPFRIYSTEERIKNLKIVGEVIKRNPIFGVGFNSFRFAQERYNFRVLPGVTVSHADASTDNSFLFVLATTGIFGFLSFGYFWKKIFQILQKTNAKLDSYNKTLSAIAISSIVGVFVSSMFNNSLFFPFIMEWLWVIVGLAISRKNTELSS